MRDAELKELISQVHTANYRVYGARKIWRALNRQGHTVARCTVERLMRELGIQGAIRGKRVITTLPGGQVDRAPDRLDRDFVASAPNRCWVADFTHVATWNGDSHGRHADFRNQPGRDTPLLSQTADGHRTGDIPRESQPRRAADGSRVTRTGVLRHATSGQPDRVPLSPYKSAVQSSGAPKPGDTPPGHVFDRGQKSCRARRPAAPLQDREKHNGATNL
ncbi:IS3 family transposase [Streptomyces atratus]|uniref:IS3 family transposase n=1 Tax=Streptomyces atratus TaxID=1893 RepID=UPI0038698E9D